MLKHPSTLMTDRNDSFHDYLTTNDSNSIDTLASWNSRGLIKRLLTNGLAKAELAKKIEISVRTLNNVINGKVANLKPSAFKKLLGYYCSTILH